jgi:hypothetical protein
MKTFLFAGILGLAGALGAEAQDVHKYRNDRPRHESRYEAQRHSGFWSFFRRHRAHPSRVWVPARYETRIVGYDHCGKPIYKSVCVTEGYWTTRPVCD